MLKWCTLNVKVEQGKAFKNKYLHLTQVPLFWEKEWEKNWESEGGNENLIYQKPNEETSGEICFNHQVGFERKDAVAGFLY